MKSSNLPLASRLVFPCRIPVYFDAIRLLEKVHFQEYENILHLGCSSGNLSGYLSYLCPHGSVTGIDKVHEKVIVAKNIYSHEVYKNLNFIEGDVLDANLEPYKYDSVVSFNLFHQIRNKDRLLRKIKDSLSPKGKLIFSVPYDYPWDLKQALVQPKWDYYFGEKSERNFLSKRAYENLLRDDFHILYLKHIHKSVSFPSFDIFFEACTRSLPHFEVIPSRHRAEYMQDLKESLRRINKGKNVCNYAVVEFIGVKSKN